MEDTSDSDSEVSNESSGVKYESDVMNLDQDFDDDHFVEYQSDIEETVTVVKKSTNCEIYGLTYKVIKIHFVERKQI